MKRNGPGIWVMAVSLAAFAWGMSVLFRDRLEAGDIYPAYSTLRSDPMGCRAFFSALERYPGLAVKRAFARADFRGQAPGAAYFFLGLDPLAFGNESELLKELDTLARQGHRVVIGLSELVMREGREYKLQRTGLLDGDSSARDRKGGPAAARDTLRDSAGAARYLREWGFRMRIDTAFRGDGAGKAAAVGNLKDTLPWLSGVHFESLKGPWTVLYRRRASAKESPAVAAERPLGSGSVVLVSDSYFASNQAQFHSSPARFAGLLLGGADRVFFDERHLGVRRDDSIAGLLRRYRLHWMLPSLLLLLALYVWKERNLPVPETEGEPAPGAPSDAHSALAGLLGRNLGPRQALEACFGLWKESASGTSGGPKPALEAEIAAVLERRGTASGNGSLAAAYAEIQAILNPRKRTWTSPPKK
ncbi:MAG TPA: hypothetical protein VJ385_01325 [Fibrobacteria bacterium]|nr:hypothetical protein [Fibrobacteria bacterium]